MLGHASFLTLNLLLKVKMMVTFFTFFPSSLYLFNVIYEVCLESPTQKHAVVCMSLQ